MQAFNRDEFNSRLNTTKAWMERAGHEALFVINQSNIYYLTGYDGRSDYVPQALIITLADDEPKLILRMQDVPCALHTVCLASHNIIGYPEDYIGTEKKHPHEFIADLLREWKLDSLRIGIERGGAPITPAGFDRLQNALPNVVFGDVSGKVARQRMVKSSQELLYMRQAAVIADRAMQTAIDHIEVGVRECDVAAKVMAAQISGTPEFGGDRPVSPAMPAGARTSSPHLSWTDQKYESNTPINIELGGFRKRYVSGLSRSIQIGKPPAKRLALHEATKEGMSRALEAAKSGNVCQDVEAAFRSATRTHGFEKNSRIGYAMGIDWAENTASFQRGDFTVLEPDMTFHLMLGMWYDDWGYTLSETFRITDGGGESFAGLPRELFAK